MFTLRPPAKINLNLRILGKRADGYHLIESEVQTVSLHDEMEVEASRGFHLECHGKRVPCGEENILYRAYEAFSKVVAVSGIKIKLFKRIPPGRGLGGGSSDAAALLLAMREIFTPNLPFAMLQEIALKVGADVPLFLIGGRIKMEGIGEKLTALPDREGYAVLLDPGLEVTTGEVYRKYDELLEKGFDFSPYENHLLPALLSLHPELEQYPAMGMRLTGSGSCFFKTFSSLSEAREFYGKISSGRKWVVEFVPFSRYRNFLLGE